MSVQTSSEPINLPLGALPNADRLLLLKGGMVVTMDDTLGNFANGDVLIRGTEIVAVGTELSAEGAEVVDAKGMIVIPGLVDTHRHAWEGQLRRINPNSPTLEDYCNATHFSFAKYYRPQDMYVGNMLTALGCINAGITTIIDNSHNARSGAHSDAAIDALQDAGIRAVHAPGAPLSGEWESANWPGDLRRLKGKYTTESDSLVTLAMMSQIDREQWAVARELGLNIVTEFFGAGMASELGALQEEGLLGPDNIFNHCTCMPDQGWSILRHAGVKVNVCPRSDAHYGLEDGVFAWQKAVDHGMNPGLSVDNESSYSGDMFTEMRVAFYLQRAAAHSARFQGNQPAPDLVSARQLLKAATVDGAACAGLEAKIGSITPGKQADIVLIRTDNLSIYPSNNALGTVVHAAERGDIDTVIIAGRIRKQGGVVLGVNRQQLEAATEESRAFLFEAANYTADPFAESFTPLHTH
ncbi:amidohydrolase family protein [Pseudomonas sp. 14P_8.1_Bac3]|uniref:amidohydrolase family protein n=1 Tax=Pseudomonas sp. 14P_8.1_Bac3 TaxID=2971621 RepID=UPI0021C5E78C|nr:amidohydrolase family protein [Pseudomonas sp. 14P_8.1_Bac3]MCU1760786.1 amidohydrolase family protein [Pseudomonas sp. 14P_8.1_Bac3]